MTLEQLRIFVSVAERQHLTEAAEALGRTQSAVSAAIKALETRHDLALFDRVGRRIRLTMAGEAFLPIARDLLRRAEAATAALDDLSGARRGALIVAASQTVGNYWLPRRLARLAHAHPQVDLSARIGNTHEAAAWVAEGDAELGVVEGEPSDPRLETVELPGDDLLFVASPAEATREALLGARRWLLREPGSGTRAEAERALARLGLPLAQAKVLVLPSNEAVLNAAREGAGVAYLSTLVVEDALAAGALRRLDLPGARRAFRLIRRKDAYASRLARAFEALARGV